jgi:hypothetical protein
LQERSGLGLNSVVALEWCFDATCIQQRSIAARVLGGTIADARCRFFFGATMNCEELENEKADKVQKFLWEHQDEFERDPEDDSFYVNKRILESLRKLTKKSPFKLFTEGEFAMHAMQLDVGGQLEFFPNNAPGIERIVMIKGDGLCLIHLHPIFSWEESKS